MDNCIFSGHCINMRCDKSCPALVETSYLLDRNGISISNDVFHSSEEDLQAANKLITDNQGKLKVYISKNTITSATLLTYVGICQNWRGSQLHCTVYNLKFFQYLEAIKKSWNSGSSDNLEYTKIWASTSKLLIVSNIDFVNFKNFECQTLLELIQSRLSNPELTTIIVSPQLSALVGEGSFFSALMEILKKAAD